MSTDAILWSHAPVFNTGTMVLGERKKTYKTLMMILGRLQEHAPPHPKNFTTSPSPPQDAAQVANEWYSNNVLEELCALRDKSQEKVNLPIIITRLRCYTVEDEDITRVHSGALITVM